MAAYRPDVTRFSTNEKSANFQRKPPFLRSRNTAGLVRTLSYVRVSNISKMAACNRKWIWNNIYFSFVYMIATKFQRLYLCFRRQATQLDWSGHCCLSSWVRIQRWRLVTRCGYEITHISACMHDSNEIPTAIPIYHDCTCANTALGYVVYQRWRLVTGSA